MNDQDQGIFERVIRLDERAAEAHRRLDRHENIFAEVTQKIESLEKGVNSLRLAVASLNTKAGFAAAIGSLIGGGIIAAIVSVWFS